MAATTATLPIISSVIKTDGRQKQSTAVRPPSPPPSLSLKPPQSATKPPSLPAAIFSVFDGIINTFIDPPRKSTHDPRHILAGNFSPVAELPPTECQVVHGVLPSCLDGAYIRNGPNPQFLPRGPYHLFDGDGMLHSIRISKGKATLCSRFVKTYRYRVNSEQGSSIIPSMFSGYNGLLSAAARGALMAARVLAGQYDPRNGAGTANTSLALIAGKLYALGESDLPYSVKIDSDGEIHTLGRCDFTGKLEDSMTAHPKTDPETGETFAFRYDRRPPFLTYFRFSAAGEKQPDVPINYVTTPSFLHDFGITKRNPGYGQIETHSSLSVFNSSVTSLEELENQLNFSDCFNFNFAIRSANWYAIFNDIQIGINPMAVVVGESPVGVNHGKAPRIGVIPRYAQDDSEMRWFRVAGFNPLHVTNAWDEDDGNTIVMVAPNMLAVEHTLERMDLIHSSIEKIKIELKTGIVSRHPLSTRNLELPVINSAFVGRKNKYVYAAVGDPMPWLSGIVKLDLSISENDRRDCIVSSRLFGPGCFGGEPFFVSRQPDNPNADEDDGYLLNYVHDENTKESRFLVMDAKSPNLDIVAAVRLPARVPYGFHGLFVKENDLNKL